MSKQATLFQSWGGKKTKPPSQQPGTSTGGQGSNQGSDPVVDLCDEDDDDDYLLAMAMEQSLKEIEGQGPAQGCSSNIAKKSAKTTKENKPTKKKASTAKASSSTSAKPAAISSLFKSVGGVSSEKAKSVVNNDAGFEDIPDDEFDEEMGEMPDLSDLEDLPGFDKYAGRTWIYPTNYPVRAYQYSIVRQALYKNTMVVLPTGLGKTFIAAVVMYNFYRWYPQGKVIFMAPTKPLVAQQIEACYNIMGIPQGHTAEMTGAMPPADRQHAWTERRVFFLTPQVLTNDLSRSACPATEVKCVVVDEAHKALGNHAYCQVVRELVKHSPEFRVLALSATPGSDIKAVQQVFTNLLISHVELRSEDSDDIQKYTHERRVDKLVIPQGAELKAAQEKYLQVLNILVGRLKRQGVLYNRDAKSLSKFLILKAREAFRQNPPQNLQRPAYGAIEGDFALCMSLYHGYELLQLHGLRSLYNFLESIMTGDKAQGRARTELLKNRDFCELMDELRGKFKAIKSLDPNASFRGPATQSNPVSLGHPKMAKLQEVVLEHFKKFEEANDTTRIMIFSQYRDSVNEITEMLSQHRPSVRVMSFVGQSSAGKSSRGFTQKEQLKVMARFRDGGFNTLVSTCVGEEGLDIGDVDLIICFDAHKSPIRLVQRMGRTGRKREGRIVMLVTEGKEEQIYNQSQYNKKSIHKAILNGARSLIYYAHNPRMVPDGLIPACHKMHISVTAKYQPKVKGQGQAKVKAAPRQSTASARRSSVRGPVAHDGFLTSTELHYWDQHYKTDDEGHTLPPSEFVTLRNKLKTPPVPPAQRSLSLTDWLPWQNELQDTQLVGHSQTTRDYVDLMAFMDRQGEIGPEEDNYSLEMEMYLNTEDVLKPGQRNIVTAGNHGILRFCSADTAKTGDSKKRTPPVVPSDDSDAEDFLKHGPRRSELLPQFEDDVQLETESDDELPDGLDTVAIKKSTKTAKKPSTAAPKSKGKAGSRGKTKNKSVPAETPVEKPSVNKTEKKNPGFKDALQSFKFEERPSKDESVSTSKKRPSTESVISAIEEEDEDDFEVETEMSKDLKDRKRRSMESIAAAADWNDDENVDDFQELQPVELDDPNTEEEEEMHLEELLPIFNSRKDKEINSKSKGKKVRTPPPLEDLAEAFADLDKQGKISPVDMLDMMDDWGQTCSTRPSISDSVLAKFGEETSFCVRNVTDDDHKDDDLRNQVNGSQSPLPDGLDNRHPVPMDLEPRSVEKCKLRKLSKSNGVVKINPLKTSPLKMENSFSFLDVSKGSRISDLVSDNTNSTNCDNIGNSPLKKPSSRYSSESASEDRTKSESKMSSGCSQMDLDDFDDPFTLETASAVPETEKENSHSRNSSFSKPAESNEGKLFSAKPASRHVAFAPSLDTPIRVVPSSTSTPVIPLKPHQPQTLVCETPGFSPTAPKSSLKAGHQSFFDEDDSLFSHVSSFSHDLGQSVTKTPRPKPEMSQYTFTQALDCVDSGGNSGTSARVSDLSNEAGSEVKDLPSISSPQSVGSDRDSDSIIFTGRTTSQMKTNNGQEKKEDSKAKSLEESQEPQFDLGFDLDDFDDDIIPPSPEHVIRPASSQRFSVTMVTMSTSGVDANKSETNPVESKTVEKEKQSPFPHCSPPLAVTNKARPVAIVTPNSVPEEPESPPQPVGAASKVVWDPDAETMDISAMDCEELEEPADSIEDEDEADESIIHAPRGRKKAAILVLSPESPKVPASKSFRATSNEGFKTPVLPAPRAGGQKRLRVSSEEDSPVSRPVAKKKVLMLDDDDDDDFEVPGKLGRGSSKPAVYKSDSSPAPKPAAKAKKPRPRSAGHGYLEVEAELSSDGAGSSDDEDGSDLDEYDASFVNDMTQLSQAATVDMRAVYMQSVRSPALRGPVGGSRASYGRHGNHDEDVFSQVPQQDTEYEEDSFCVGDDDDESEMVDDFHDDYEDTMMQEAIRQSLKSNDKPKVKATGSRRRVVRLESSSEDDSPMKAAGKVSKPTNISKDSSSKDSYRCRRTSPPMNDSVAVNPTCGSDTPVLSLKSRIQGRLKSVASDISDKPRAKPAQTNRSSAKTSSISVSSDYSTDKSGNSSKSSTSLPTADQPTFSLGLDEFDMTDDDEEDVFTDLPVPPKEAFKVPPQNPSPVKSDTSGSQPSPLVPFTSYNTSPGSTITTGSKVVSPPGGSAISREERLRISRLKQEEFKRKLEQQKKNRTGAGSLHDDGLPSNASINMSVSSLSGIAQMTRASSVSMATSATNSTANISMATKAGSISHASGNDFTKLKNKLIVLVSSKEINGAQDLVSSLRFQHNIQTVVKSMSHCDYIVSNRMAVERRVVSDFTNGSHKGALLERLRSLCEMFDRPCLIVERDRVKPGEDKGPGKTLLRSRYVEQTIASLGQTHVKLLFSESQDHSAELMAELCTQEHRKNTHITVTTELSAQQEQVLRFYLSLPKISYITALCLLHKFKSVAEFIKSPVSVLERRGQLPRTKAQDIHAYLRHPYDGQMVAVSKR